MFLLTAQKSKVISVFQLIESGKYKEAKEVIDEAGEDENTRDWARTWYAKGLLCQSAYKEGKKKNDKKLYELYPEQLFLAYESYKQALDRHPRGRLETQLESSYVTLANDFQELGQKEFENENYSEALKAFEYALNIVRSPSIDFHISDTNLVYNSALAAFENKDWGQAIDYLKDLQTNSYSSNASHLLYLANLNNGDTLAAAKVLIESISNYENNEDLILLLADLLYKTGDVEKAMKFLNKGADEHPKNYIFPYTSGLILQKVGRYDEAIPAYKVAIELAPEEYLNYKNAGTCYYNIGVEIDKHARTISNNKEFQEEKVKAESAFRSSISYLEKANKLDPENQDVIRMLFQLYKTLHITDKQNDIEKQFK